MQTRERNQVFNYNLIKNYVNNSKGKIVFALAKLHTWAFIFSVILMIAAGNIAYSVAMEEKTAQSNADDLLEKFEQMLLISKSFELNTAIYEELLSLIELQEPTSIATSTSGPTDMTTASPIDPSQAEHKPVAKLHIEKIGLNISVLSEWSYDLLDFSVCKYSGPEPNEPGNFVIVGHNDRGGVHFGKLKLLENGDLIDITDLSGRKKRYEVYEISTIKPEEIDKLATDEICTVTLVTCDSSGDLRLIIKSRELI